jgi:hypothetical protein
MAGAVAFYQAFQFRQEHEQILVCIHDWPFKAGAMLSATLKVKRAKARRFKSSCERDVERGTQSGPGDSPLANGGSSAALGSEKPNFSAVSGRLRRDARNSAILSVAKRVTGTAGGITRRRSKVWKRCCGI